MASDYVHETTFHVRYFETDQMGVVHHSVYFTWFEEGRSDMLRAYGSSYKQMEAEGFFLPVTECHARFIAPARYDEQVTVRTRISALKSRKLTFTYEIIGEDGRLLVEGWTAHICTDPEGRIRRLPRMAIEAWQHPPDGGSR